ncbi:hypothetical protein RchiOBHm_Chr3g0487791 [Rosa chinensis]|uniref:Uncharacterized protein n=1 Tax=Rosa chinensis TaxID=74649 RepID=A0A2P6RFK4_ROSCH|nr:hypothetical protein RchiOBHm_Chr3g0487791 [Rosa chinensis]
MAHLQGILIPIVQGMKALNLIFRQWGIEANMKQWNITGDPCSGAASDSTAFDSGDYNPFIK